jgi:hypothetical protein
MAQVLRRRPRSTVMWGRKKVCRTFFLLFNN